MVKSRILFYCLAAKKESRQKIVICLEKMLEGSEKCLRHSILLNFCSNFGNVATLIFFSLGLSRNKDIQQWILIITLLNFNEYRFCQLALKCILHQAVSKNKVFVAKPYICMQCLCNQPFTNSSSKRKYLNLFAGIGIQWRQ